MRVLIHENDDNVARWTARYIVDEINKKAKITSAPFVLGLPTGSTPLGVYKELIKFIG